MTQLELPLMWPEIDVDGLVDTKHDIVYYGWAVLQPNNKWRCLANVGGCLCVVEASISMRSTLG